MFDPEKLTYWFLRLNGFFTIQNFVVHPNEGANQVTDIDVFGVRFPKRAELSKNSMRDYELFTKFDIPVILLTEVKTSLCNLNGPWTRHESQTMDLILRALGAFKESDYKKITNDLCMKGYYEDRYRIQILLIGDSVNNVLKKKYPEIPQLTYNEILKFIYNRFYEYRLQKVSHPQWDNYGKFLYSSAMNYDFKRFLKQMKTSNIN